MKPFTSKHCTPMFYGSPLNQKDEKGDKSPLDIRKSIEAQSRAAREQRAVKGVNQANVKSRLKVRKKDWDKNKQKEQK